jgi:peptide/nickel transport system substrate-binding protein
MKSKTILAILGSLLALVMVLTACQPAEQTSTETQTVKGEVSQAEVPSTSPETPTAPQPTTPASPEMVMDSLGRMVEKPQYGGILPFVVGQTGGFDPANVFNFFPSWVLIYDALVCEDWTKGPSGTGEAPLISNTTSPEHFTSWLAESWEIHDLYSVTYYLREGVRFQNKPPVNGREFNADDVVYNFDRFVAHDKSSWYQSEITITKIDKYTVRFDSPDPILEIVKLGYNNFVIGAPEVAEQYGDMTDWNTVVGTGPFTVTDVVPDSSVTYTRNPDYWAHDPLHPENQLPYIDTLKALVILDPATQDAALRTGKIARLSLSKERADVILTTNPELSRRKYPSGNSQVLSLRTDLNDMPYADKRVRQALMMAIDHESIKDDYYLGDATMLQWPYQPTYGSAYTPLEELPEDLAKFWDYRPDEAKALLAEAGYPNGFKMEIRVLANYAGGAELYSIVKSYWDAIGVDTSLTVLEAGAFWSQLVGHTYTDAIPSAWGNTTVAGAILAHTTDYLYNYSVVSDAHVDEVWDEARTIVDVEERNALLKELGLYLIEQQYWLHMPTPQQYMMWQPWLKGYNGEVAFGTLNGWYGMYRFTWIDQSLQP